MIEIHDGVDMVNQDNLFNNVDLCVTCVSPTPPTLPLREELTSLGIELIYNAKGVGKQIAFKEYEKKIQDRQSICYAFLSILPGAESHGFNNEKLSKQVAISYEKYLSELSLRRRSIRRNCNLSDTLDSDNRDVECNQSRIERRTKNVDGFECICDDDNIVDTLEEETKLTPSSMNQSNTENPILSSSSSDDEDDRNGNNMAQLHVALVCSMNPSMSDDELDQYSHSYSSFDDTNLGISKNDQQYGNYTPSLEDHQNNLNLFGFIPVQGNFEDFQVVLPGEDRQQQQDVPREFSKRGKLLGIKISQSDKKLLKKALQRNKSNGEEERKQGILLTSELTSSLSTQANHFLQLLESDLSKHINDSPAAASNKIQNFAKKNVHNLSQNSLMTCETKEDDTSEIVEVKKEEILAADNEMVERMIKFHDGLSLFQNNDDYQLSIQSSGIGEDESKCEVSINTSSMCDIDDISSVDTLDREWRVNTSRASIECEKELYQVKSDQDVGVSKDSSLPAEPQMDKSSKENKVIVGDLESSHSSSVQQEDVLTKPFEFKCETKDTDDCDFEDDDDDEEEENLLGVILSGIRTNCGTMMCQPFSRTRKTRTKVSKSDSFVMSHTILETISEDETFSDDDLPMHVTTTQNHYKSGNLNVI